MPVIVQAEPGLSTKELVKEMAEILPISRHGVFEALRRMEPDERLAFFAVWSIAKHVPLTRTAEAREMVMPLLRRSSHRSERPITIRA